MGLWGKYYIVLRTEFQGRYTSEIIFQDHDFSIALEEYDVVLKTCPGVKKIVLGVENGKLRAHRSHFFLYSRTVIHCEQVADFSEL